MARPTLSDRAILAQVPPARQRARASQAVATQARYDRAHRRLHVTLASGATLLVPVALIASLRQASDADLARVRIGAAGVGLRWDELDEDLSIAGLARVALGRHVLLSASGAAGGAARTAAKVRAARANGRKGGRPRR
jgi:hypothetical protein